MIKDIFTFGEMIRQSSKEYASNIALQMRCDDGTYRKYSYAELELIIKKVNAFLLEKGIIHGDRVALISENRPEWVFAYMGIISIGAIVVPLDPKLETDEIFNLVEDSQCKLFFSSSALLEKTIPAVEKMSTKIEIVNLDNGFSAVLLSDITKERRLKEVQPDDIAAIIYTSGTTGSPKGVMLSHKNILSNAISTCNVLYVLGPDDNFLSVLPAYHTLETIAEVAALLLGATTTFAESLKSHNILRNMQETKVSVMVGVPLLFRLFYDGIFRQVQEKGPVARAVFGLMMNISKLGSKILSFGIKKRMFRMIHDKFGGNIKVFACGGAALDPEINKGFDAMGFVMLQGYGLTETSPVLSFNRIDDNVFGSVGKPYPGIELRIYEKNKDAKGPNVMKGYYKKPEATAEIIRDGWFHTGDLGKFDKRGNLKITGRCKDVIVLGSGVNVYPDEIEFALMKSSLIKEVCVFGKVIKDGARKGMEEVCAAVFPDIEAIPNSTDKMIYDLINSEIERLGKELTEYKRIAKFYISKEELPKTATKKVKRFVVKKTYE